MSSIFNGAFSSSIEKLEKIISKLEEINKNLVANNELMKDIKDLHRQEIESRKSKGEEKITVTISEHA